MQQGALNGDGGMAEKIHEAVLSTKQDSFRGNKVKERKIWRAILAVVQDEKQADDLLALVKAQREY